MAAAVSARRAQAAMAAALLLLVAGCRVRPPAPDVQEQIDAILAALAVGDIEGATTMAEAARGRHPRHGGVAITTAAIHDLLWREDLAIAAWREALASQDRGGMSPGRLQGRLGEQLFLAGRFGEALAPLLAGSAEELGRRRLALVTVARELPFRRRVSGPLMTEQALLEGALPEFLCSAGAVERPFVVDTGSSTTAVAASVADLAQARARADLGGVPDGKGQTIPAAMGVIDAFAVGDVQLGAIPVLIVPDENLAMRDFFGGPDRPPEGVLGLDVLALFRMTLDAPRRRLVLERPRGLATGDSVQCVRSDGRCLVPLAIEGRRLWFVLDTGASHSSITKEGLMLLPGGESRAQPGFRRVRSAGGSSLSVREVRSLVLRVSQTRFSGVDLPVVPRVGSGLFPVHGVLGADLIAQCRLTFDQGRIRMEAEP